MADQKEFQKSLEKIEALVQVIESSADSPLRTSAIELMQSLMALHSAGIERMLEIACDAGAAGKHIIDEFGGDELVASLLLLYGLHPLDLESRVRLALDKLQPYLQSSGGRIESLEIGDGVVRLALEGTWSGCASSTMAVKQTIEEAVYEAAPDLNGLVVEGLARPPISLASGLVQIKPAAAKTNSTVQP